MKKSTKIGILIASGSLLLGFLLFGIAFIIQGGKITALSICKYEKKTFESTEKFSDIHIAVSTADVVVYPSEDEACRVIYQESQQTGYTISIENNVLSISENKNQRKWYEYVGFIVGFPHIDLYLPETEYGEFMLEGTTGDVTVNPAFVFEDMKVTLSTGDVTVKEAKGNKWNIVVTTGDVNLTDSIIDEIGIQATTGDVTFTRCDGDIINVETSTGDIEGTFLSLMECFAKTSTGDIHVPEFRRPDPSSSIYIPAGTCNLKTTTGDIDIKIISH